jgi:DNA modification methylase
VVSGRRIEQEQEYEVRTGAVRVLIGDCREKLRELPAKSVQCVVTSPPYWGLRDYGTGTWEGGDEKCEHVLIAAERLPWANKVSGPNGASVKNGDAKNWTKTRGGRCAKCGAVKVDRQIGQEATPAEYVATMVAVFREVWRVLRDDGVVWLNLGDSYASGGGHSDAGVKERREDIGAGERPGHEYRGFRVKGHRGKRGKHQGKHAWAGEAVADEAAVTPNRLPIEGLKAKDLVGIPWRVAFALQEAGWWLRSEVIWAKPNPMPESVRDRPTKAHEQVFLLTKGERYFYDRVAIEEASTERPAGNVNVPKGAKAYAHGAKEHRTKAGLLAYAQRTRDNFRRGTGKYAENGKPGAKPQHREGEPSDYALGVRNKRSVWTMATRPYRGAHFAVMPAALVEPCVRAGTSAFGACVVCGKPWVRLVERGEPDLAHRRACGGTGADGTYDGVATKDFESAGAQDASAVKARILEGMRVKRTAGWRAGCGCLAVRRWGSGRSAK